MAREEHKDEYIRRQIEAMSRKINAPKVKTPWSDPSSNPLADIVEAVGGMVTAYDKKTGEPMPTSKPITPRPVRPRHPRTASVSFDNSTEQLMCTCRFVNERGYCTHIEDFVTSGADAQMFLRTLPPNASKKLYFPIFRGMLKIETLITPQAPNSLGYQYISIHEVTPSDETLRYDPSFIPNELFVDWRDGPCLLQFRNLVESYYMSLPSYEKVLAVIKDGKTITTFLCGSPLHNNMQMTAIARDMQLNAGYPAIAGACAYTIKHFGSCVYCHNLKNRSFANDAPEL